MNPPNSNPSLKRFGWQRNGNRNNVKNETGTTVGAAITSCLTNGLEGKAIGCIFARAVSGYRKKNATFAANGVTFTAVSPGTALFLKSVVNNSIGFCSTPTPKSVKSLSSCSEKISSNELC